MRAVDPISWIRSPIFEYWRSDTRERIPHQRPVTRRRRRTTCGPPPCGAGTPVPPGRGERGGRSSRPSGPREGVRWPGGAEEAEEEEVAARGTHRVGEADLLGGGRDAGLLAQFAGDGGAPVLAVVDETAGQGDPASRGFDGAGDDHEARARRCVRDGEQGDGDGQGVAVGGVAAGPAGAGPAGVGRVGGAAAGAVRVGGACGVLHGLDGMRSPFPGAAGTDRRCA